MAEVTDALFDLVCNELDITWDDEGTKKKMRALIARGMAELDDYAGAPQDYDEPGQSQRLLIEYCRYDLAAALADFPVHYKGDLIALRERVKVAAVVAAREEAADLAAQN